MRAIDWAVFCLLMLPPDVKPSIHLHFLTWHPVASCGQDMARPSEALHESKHREIQQHFHEFRWASGASLAFGFWIILDPFFKVSPSPSVTICPHLSPSITFEAVWPKPPSEVRWRCWKLRLWVRDMAKLDPGHAALLGFKTIIEPFRIHSTQRILFPTREERLQAIQRAGLAPESLWITSNVFQHFQVSSDNSVAMFFQASTLLQWESMGYLQSS